VTTNEELIAEAKSLVNRGYLVAEDIRLFACMAEALEALSAPVEVTERERLADVLSEHRLYASDDGGVGDKCDCGLDVAEDGRVFGAEAVNAAHDAHVAGLILAAGFRAPSASGVVYANADNRPDDTEIDESIADEDSFAGAMFEIASKYDIPVTNNEERWQDGVYLRHIADFIADVQRVSERFRAPATGGEWEYGIRAEGDDEPYSDHSDDLDWLTDEFSFELGDRIVKRRKAGPWVPVESEEGAER
jgi:hypothetical protein